MSGRLSLSTKLKLYGLSLVLLAVAAVATGLIWYFIDPFAGVALFFVGFFALYFLYMIVCDGGHEDELLEMLSRLKFWGRR